MRTKKTYRSKNRNNIKHKNKSNTKNNTKNKNKSKKRSNKRMVKKGGQIKLVQTNEFESFLELNNTLINVLTQQNILLGQIICMKIFLENLIVVTLTHIFYFSYILRPNSKSYIVLRDKRSVLYGDLCERIEISKPYDNTFILFYMSGKIDVFTIDKGVNKIVPIITATSDLIQKNHNLVSLATKGNNNN